MFDHVDWAGVTMATATVCLLAFGNFCGNYLCILFWFKQNDISLRPIPNLSLSWPGLFHFVAFNLFCSLSLISHLRASFSDPGFIPSDLKPPDSADKQSLIFCEKCNNKWKPARSHHCSNCRRCVMKMDHHCPWVNNCVGVSNYKHFLLFVGYTLVSSLYLCALMVLSFYHLVQSSKTHKEMIREEGYAAAFLCGVIAFVEGILFAMFTFELLQEQMESLEDNQMFIDDRKQLWGKP